VWYPIGLSRPGSDTLYKGVFEETKGFGFGVMNLSDINSNGIDTARIRYVYLKTDWDPTCKVLKLHRYGRVIGELLDNGRYPDVE
jgi:hypothetical protein